jgi:tol-pal system protein YbgF
MIRSARFALIALACAWCGTAARAQDAAEIVTRLDRLEATIRELTGQVEQLQYRNQQLSQQLQALQEQRGGPAASAALPRPNPQYAAPQPQPQHSAPQPQYAARPAEPYPAQPQYTARPAEPYPAEQYPGRSNPQYSSSVPYPPPAPVEAGQGGSGGRHDAFNPALSPGAPGAPRALGSSTNQNEPPPRQAGAPLDLAHLSPPGDGGASGAAPPPPPADAAGAVAALPPNATPKDEFELAHGYFVHKDYANAAEAYRDFLHKHPSDRLAPEAQYWLGESLFQRQQYHDAAEAFLAVSTKYETTARAPDALLRLGQSLAALGEKEAACASLGEVMRKYPRASLSVKQNVEREQKRAHC